MFDLLASESPEIEFVSGTFEDDKPANKVREEALKVLADIKTVFPANDQFKQSSLEVSEDETTGRLVAVKKSKMNAFNDRDGI